MRSPENPRQECAGLSPENSCIYGANTSPTYAVWGDSHAGTLIGMIGELARRHGQSVKFLYQSSCPPIAGVGRRDVRKNCFSHNKREFNYLLSAPDLHTIIMVSRWSVYLEGYNRDFGPAERNESGDAFITDELGSVMNSQRRERLFEAQMRITVEKLAKSGKTVVLVYPIPETGYNIPETLAKLAFRGVDPGQFTRPESYYSHRQKFVTDVFDALKPADKIIRIHPERRLCDGINCIVYANGKPLYRDDDHLSLAGADYLSDLFEPLFSARSSQAASP